MLLFQKIINKKKKWRIDESELHTNTKITPLDGEEGYGKIEGTIIRGEMVYDGEKILRNPGFGRFIPGSYEGD